MNEFEKNIITISENISSDLANLNSICERSSKDLSKRNTLLLEDKSFRLTKGLLNNILLLIKGISLNFYSKVQNISICDKDTVDALKYAFSKIEFRFLKHFHTYLFALASNFILAKDSISSKMLFVYGFLYKCKDLVNTQFNLNIFNNLDELILQNEALFEYREKIAEKVDNARYYDAFGSDLFYITNIKPFFVNGKVYYELTVKPAGEAFSRFCKFTAFSNKPIPSNYAIRLDFITASVNILNREMRIRLVNSFKVAIRMIEIDDLASIVNYPYDSIDMNEYDRLMDYLTKSEDSLLDIIDLCDSDYSRLKSEILKNISYPVVFNVLDKCREIIIRRKNGYVTIRYLLLKMRHRVMRNQIANEQNSYFSSCYLKPECIPFENTPFDASLCEHTPHIFDILLCLNNKNRKGELLARRIKINTEEKGTLFTPLNTLRGLDNVKRLVRDFNMSLSNKHMERRELVINKGNIYIKGYEKDTFEILARLYKFTGCGIANYKAINNDWIINGSPVDSNEKAGIISRMFLENRIAIVYGLAGTGKTTLMKHIADIFADNSKLFLAKTNSAVISMRKFINSPNSEFKTIDSWLNLENSPHYDILFVDECPTIDNRGMNKLLSKVSCKAIFLTGDLYQIQSIRFGNWFGLAKHFLPQNAVFELTVPYRTSSADLVDLFNKARRLDDGLIDYLTNKSFISDFDDSLFYKDEDDEILISFNYDGLYGINNLNSFLQNSNAYVPEYWDCCLYKSGDPIIFTENNCYSAVLHKNLKGKIISVNKTPYRITFKLEVFDKIDEERAIELGLEICESDNKGHNIIILSVDKYEDNIFRERSIRNTVPFQLAYATSIYKAQGMEFNSVKIVITEDMIDYITHNLLYTAITRARKSLKIYSTKETMEKLFEKLKSTYQNKDIYTLAKIHGIKIDYNKQ